MIEHLFLFWVNHGCLIHLTSDLVPGSKCGLIFDEDLEDLVIVILQRAECRFDHEGMVVSGPFSSIVVGPRRETKLGKSRFIHPSITRSMKVKATRS